MDDENKKTPFLQKYKFSLISLFIIVLAAIPLLLLSNTAGKKATNMQQQVPTTMPSPTAAPLTTTNAQPTLTQEDTTLQQTLNQVDTDIKAANSIDSSQDSTAGL